MKKIKLSGGAYTTVDDDIYDYLNQWNWRLSSSGYAMRRQHMRLGVNKYTSKTVWMHRLVNKTPDHLLTDHINQNKLDNRRGNLRNTNKSLNALNCSRVKANTSGHHGVHFDTWSNKWRAEIKIKGKKISLGRFDNINDAATARKMAEATIDYYAI